MKKSKSVRGKKDKKKKEKEPFISKYAPVDYEKLRFIPDVKLTIKLGNIKSESSTFEVKLPENATVSRIKDVINDKHNGACSNIILYIDLTDKSKNLEKVLNKRLHEIGIVGEFNIYYEFEPIKHPLLEM